MIYDILTHYMPQTKKLKDKHFYCKPVLNVEKDNERKDSCFYHKIECLLYLKFMDKFSLNH